MDENEPSAIGLALCAGLLCLLLVIVTIVVLLRAVNESVEHRMKAFDDAGAG